MKKLISIVLISCASCSNNGYIFYTKSVKKCIHNLEQVEKWIHYDIENNVIPAEIGEEYMVAITHTKLSLKEKYKKYDK